MKALTPEIDLAAHNGAHTIVLVDASPYDFEAVLPEAYVYAQELAQRFAGNP